jgi:hypothetical protein
MVWFSSILSSKLPTLMEEPLRSSTLDRSSSFLSSYGFKRSWLATNPSPSAGNPSRDPTSEAESCTWWQAWTTGKRAAALGPFCFRYFLLTRVSGAAGSYFFSFLLLASPFRSPVPPCLLGNPPDCPWPIALPPPPPAQSVCSIPIFNNYNSITNLWTQPQNTEPLRENTMKHERSGGKSLRRKKNGLCARCFCRPKHEGHVPNAFWANEIPTATYVRRKTLLVLAVLYVLMWTISMFPMPVYPALNQPFPLNSRNLILIYHMNIMNMYKFVFYTFV